LWLWSPFLPRVGDGQGLYLPFQEGLQRTLRHTDRFLEAFMGFSTNRRKLFGNYHLPRSLDTLFITVSPGVIYPNTHEFDIYPQELIRIRWGPVNKGTFAHYPKRWSTRSIAGLHVYCGELGQLASTR